MHSLAISINFRTFGRTFIIEHMKQNDNSWQARYVIRYAGSQAAAYYRPLVRSILENLARLKAIQHAWGEGEQIYKLLGGENTLSGLYTETETLYLRSLPQTTIDRRQFHQIVSAVFPDHSLGVPVTIDKIAQRLLKRLPWPLGS